MIMQVRRSVNNRCYPSVVVTTTCIVRFIGTAYVDAHVHVWLLGYSTYIHCNSMELIFITRNWEGGGVLISTVIRNLYTHVYMYM